jgi:hypothetical protein
MPVEPNEGSKHHRVILVWLLTLSALAVLIVLAQERLTRAGVHFFPPPLADGLRCNNWHTCSEQSQAFTAILLRRFPLGSKVDVLKSALLAQGFGRFLPTSITACLPHGQEAPIGKMVIECPEWDANWNPRNDLEYHWGGPLCGSGLIVRWSSNKGGRIAHLDGNYDYACL